MSNCERCKGLINQKLDNELLDLEQPELEEHLKQCDSCSTYYQRMSDLHNRLLSLPIIDTQESIVDQLILDIDNIKKENKDIKFKSFNKHWFTRYGLATAAAIVLFVVPITFLANQNNIEESADSVEFMAAEAPDEKASISNLEIQTDNTLASDSVSRGDGNYGAQAVAFELYKIEEVSNQLIISKDEEVIFKTKQWEDNLSVEFYQINENEISYSLLNEDGQEIASYIINLIENKEDKILD
ncbi:MAG: hypothetical protein AB7V16_00285 [Vulcanibacillus sp.]